MTQEERTGERDLTYSAWHRRDSIKRFVGAEKAQLLAMIDIDVVLFVEYDDSTKEPVCLIEIARDTGQSIKPSTVTRKLAEKAKLPAYTLLYTPSKNTKNPADNSVYDIEKFRIKMICPEETDLMPYSPSEWAHELIEIHPELSEEPNNIWMKTKDEKALKAAIRSLQLVLKRKEKEIQKLRK